MPRSKVKYLEDSRANWQAKAKARSIENKRLREANKRVEASRDKWRDRFITLERELAAMNQKKKGGH